MGALNAAKEGLKTGGLFILAVSVIVLVVLAILSGGAAVCWLILALCQKVGSLFAENSDLQGWAYFACVVFSFGVLVAIGSFINNLRGKNNVV